MVTHLRSDGIGTYRRPPRPEVMIGVDIGQRVDPTAIVVNETYPMGGNGKRRDYVYETRFMHRVPLGTPYPEVAKIIRKVVHGAIIAATRPDCIEPEVIISVDSTGVGRPVIDLLRDELHGVKGQLRAVTFVYSDKMEPFRGQYREWRVGKQYMVSRLQALFVTNRLSMPQANDEAKAMMKELMEYEVRINDKGHDQYGAFKTGVHDDLVTALGLAVLVEPGRLATARSF